MAVIEREKRNRVFGEIVIDPRIRALIASPASRASNGSGAPRGGTCMLEVMCDPYEWKSAVRFGLVIFVGFLALSPALAPDQKELAAKINHQTLKAAAAIKSPAR
jgi:hypothetical protein